MHIEFIDKLRCPKPHEESSLVAALYKLDGRTIVEAKLGCPVCGAEYFIRDGIAVFQETVVPQEQPGADQLDSVFAPALLDLSRPGMLALFAGEWALESAAVAELTGTRIIALNSLSSLSGSDNVAEIRAVAPIPIVSHSLDGIALDPSHSTSSMVSEATRLLRPHGRLVLKGDAPLSHDFRELGRAAGVVVAEYVGDLVSLRR